MADIEKDMLERHTAINKAFGRMYFAIYSIDMESGRYLEVSTLDIFREHIPPEEKNRHLFDMVVKYYVSEGYKDGMREFLSMDTIQERLAGQNAISHEFFGTTQGWCRASLVVEKRDDDGRVLRYVYVTQEINEEVKTEQQRISELKRAYEAADAANQAKSDFLFRMSHDIRTPLNAIMGFDSLLEYHAGEPDSVRDYARKIRTSGNLLLSLLNEILDMTKIESGKAEPVRTLFDMRELIAELDMVIRTQTSDKGQEFSADMSGVVHTGFAGDKVRISRVLFNILGNSVKYTKKGGRIRFTAHEEDLSEEKALLVFTISDNGMGMSPELKEHIFDEFRRGGDDEVGGIPGTGLGLPIAKNFVTMMGGEISVDSEAGVGSMFTVRIPLDIDESAVKSDAAGADRTDIAGMRILVVEDNEMNMEITTELLSIAGARCDMARSGTEALKEVEESPVGSYDLILMDVRMPVMDGYETTKRIRSMDRPDVHEIPIIALTANAFEEDVDNAKNAGMDAHLAKPMDMGRLQTVLAGIKKCK